jgi:hypothetical protein
MFGNMPGGDNPIQQVMNTLKGGFKKGSKANKKNQDYIVRLENQAKMYGYQSDLKKSEMGTKGEQDRLTLGTKGSEDRLTLKEKGGQERRTIGKQAREGRADTTHGTSEAIRFHGATGAGAPSRMKTTNYDVGFNAPKPPKPTNIVNVNDGNAGNDVPSRTNPQTAGAVKVPGKKTTGGAKGGRKSKSTEAPAVDLSGF